ncbi:hypothetical protein Dimus_013198 [Dionaea muscipula]
MKGSEGEQSEKEDEATKKSSESVEDFYDPVDEDIVAPDEDTHDALAKKKSGQSSKTRRVDPSSTIPYSDLLHLQAELDRALKANARFQELLQQVKPNPPAPPSS